VTVWNVIESKIDVLSSEVRGLLDELEADDAGG
jgi:uncharacterized protein with HEPN domain